MRKARKQETASVSVIQGADPGKSRLIQPNPTKTVFSWFDKATVFDRERAQRARRRGVLDAPPSLFPLGFFGVVSWHRWVGIGREKRGVGRPRSGVGLLSSFVIPPEDSAASVGAICCCPAFGPCASPFRSRSWRNCSKSHAKSVENREFTRRDANRGRTEAGLNSTICVRSRRVAVWES